MPWLSIIGLWRSRSSGPVRVSHAAGRNRSGLGWASVDLTGGLQGSLRRRTLSLKGEGGLRLGGLPDGSRVVVTTLNRTYELEVRDGQVWISGHPHLCPSPVRVQVRGSSWGGSMLKTGY